MDLTIDRAIARLQRLRTQYMETGIAELETDYGANVPNIFNASAHRKMMRMTAKELKRPYIELVTTTWRVRERGPDGKYHRTGPENIVKRLQIQKRKGTDQLVGPLLLAAVKTRKWVTPEGDPPITYTETGAGWEFTFQNDVGLQVLELFRERCRTSPVARVLLKTL